MGNKNRMRRSHLKQYASSNVKVRSSSDAEKMSVYLDSVKSIKGPKDKSEPVLENSFTRPIQDGVAGSFLCSKCGCKFETTVSWTQHLRKYPALDALEHEPIFKPDREKGHFTEEGWLPHGKIYQPVKEKELKIKVWQSKTRQGITEWKWTLLNKNRKGESLFLGFCDGLWKFKREFPDGAVKYTIDYASKEMAEFYWNNSKLTWIQ